MIASAPAASHPAVAAARRRMTSATGDEPPAPAAAARNRDLRRIFEVREAGGRLHAALHRDPFCAAVAASAAPSPIPNPAQRHALPRYWCDLVVLAAGGKDCYRSKGGALSGPSTPRTLPRRLSWWPPWLKLSPWLRPFKGRVPNSMRRHQTPPSPLESALRVLSWHHPRAARSDRRGRRERQARPIVSGRPESSFQRLRTKFVRLSPIAPHRPTHPEARNEFNPQSPRRSKSPGSDPR